MHSPRIESSPLRPRMLSRSSSASSMRSWLLLKALSKAFPAVSAKVAPRPGIGVSLMLMSGNSIAAGTTGSEKRMERSTGGVRPSAYVREYASATGGVASGTTPVARSGGATAGKVVLVDAVCG